jgi:hypothetical protein
MNTMTAPIADSVGGLSSRTEFAVERAQIDQFCVLPVLRDRAG